MMFVGFLEKVDDVYYYYSVVNDKVTVGGFSGEEDAFAKKLAELKAQLFLVIFEEFLSVNKLILDPGKNVHVYHEKVKRIQSYIEWGHKNIELMPHSVADNGFVSVKFMEAIINLISKNNPHFKTLVFLKHCVIKTYKD